MGKASGGVSVANHPKRLLEMKFPLIASRCDCRIAILLFAVALLTNPSSAQTTSGTTGNTTIGQPTTTGGSLDADAAFSQVERGDTVGATGATGAGFSSAGASTGTTGRGTVSFGGFGGGLGGLGGLQSLFGGLGGQAQNSQPAIRTRLRAAIDVERPAMPVVEQRVVNRFQQLTRPQFKTVTVKVVEGRGILTGVVASQRDRRMSELLLRLEPGVREIDNQLTVQPAR